MRAIWVVLVLIVVSILVGCVWYYGLSAMTMESPPRDPAPLIEPR
jgi:hypothetical protein